MSAPPPPPPSHPFPQPQPQRSGMPVWLLVLLIAGGCFILLVAGLAALAVPNIKSAMASAHATQDLQKMRQLGMAMIRMDLDRSGDKDRDLGFPGDLADASAIKLGDSKPVRSVSDYLQRLLDHDYLTIDDIGKLTTRTPDYPGWSPGQSAAKTCGVKVYKVREQDSTDTLALAGRDFTYGAPLKAKGSYPVVHKDGSGLLYRSRHPLTTAGVLPGRKDYNDRPVETPEDTLLLE